MWSDTTRTGKTHEQLYFIVAVANIFILAVTNYPIINNKICYSFILKLKSSYTLGRKYAHYICLKAKKIVHTYQVRTPTYKIAIGSHE